jgi:hypothetical protein
LVSRFALGIVVILVIAAVAAAVVLSFPPSSTSTGTTSGSNGRMAVMGTDPPYTSGGSSAEYEHYSNMAAHRTAASNQPTTTITTAASGGSSSGWVKLNASGTLKLNTIVNASETMALANVTAGSYDSVRLYVDYALVTYNGKNYTAQTTSSQITASLNGNAQVSGSSTTVVIFDLRTVIINTGSTSSPQFVATYSARAQVVPSGSVTSASLQLGARVDLSGSAWFQTFVQGSAHLQITAAAMSSNSLNVTLKDTGAETANATLVIVTPVTALASVQIVIPDSLQGSAVFIVGPGGTLQASTSLLAQVASPGAGLAVSSSSSATLTFSGSIQFGTTLGAQVGVVTGQSYFITVIGTNTVATTTMTAS